MLRVGFDLEEAQGALLGAMEMFYIFTEVVATWLYTFVVIHQDVYFIYIGVYIHQKLLKCTFK